MLSPSVPSTLPDLTAAATTREFLDHLFQYLGVAPGHVARFLQLLDPKLARKFRLDRIQPVKRETIGDDLRLRQSDLLRRVLFRGADGKSAYVLIEIQDEPESGLPLRHAFYRDGVWREVVQAGGIRVGRISSIPLLISCTIYVGKETRPDPGGLEALVDVPEEWREELAAYAGAARIPYVDLRRVPVDHLRELGATGCILQILQTLDDDASVVVAAYADALTRLAGLEKIRWNEWRSAMWSALAFAARRGSVEYQRLMEIWQVAVEQSPHAARRKEGLAMPTSWYQSVTAEAEARGEARGARDLVIHTLEQRFGICSPAARERLESLTTLAEILGAHDAAIWAESEADFLARLTARSPGGTPRATRRSPRPGP